MSRDAIRLTNATVSMESEKVCPPDVGRWFEKKTFEVCCAAVNRLRSKVSIDRFTITFHGAAVGLHASSLSLPIRASEATRGPSGSTTGRAAIPLYITTASPLPDANVGMWYGAAISSTSQAAVTWSIVSGGTNAGWPAIDPATGMLSGTPSSFEGACPNGWTLTGDWQCGVPSNVGGPAAAYDGKQCLGTGLTVNYSNNDTWAATTATSPPIDLTAATSAMLTFRMWFDTEGGTADGANLQISTDDGVSFAVVPARTMTPAYALSIAGEPAWAIKPHWAGSSCTPISRSMRGGLHRRGVAALSLAALAECRRSAPLACVVLVT